MTLKKNGQVPPCSISSVNDTPAKKILLRMEFDALLLRKIRVNGSWKLTGSLFATNLTGGNGVAILRKDEY